MKVDEAIVSLEKVFKAVIAEYPSVLRATFVGGRVPPLGFRIGNDLFALMKLRIQQKGIDADGQKFAPYSRKPILMGYDRKGRGTVSLANNVWRAMAGSKTARKRLSWVTYHGRRLFVLPGGYYQAKSIFKGDASIVDFTVTGALMRSIKVKNLIGGGGKYTLTIAPNNDREKKKLEGNEKKRGEILKFSDGEMEVAETVIMQWLEKKIAESLGL